MADVTIQFDPHKTVPLSNFHEELWFEFQNLPTQLFDYYLLKTAREMAESAPLVLRTLTISLVPNITRYYLDPPDNTELNQLLGVRHVPTGNLECGSHDVRRFINPPEHLGCFTYGAWYDHPTKCLTLHLPNCAGKCVVSMSIKPSRDACELPAEYFDEYLPVLVMGTRASLMMITGRPWTNLRVGGELYTEYRNLTRELGVQHMRKKQAGSVKLHTGRVM